MATQDTSPLFTVIIPAKDRAKYLHHTLRTCMMQTYDRLEVIVSDDGSTDDTAEVVRDAASKDRRIRYVSQGAGVGMRDNFELALQQVKPGYVIALGADDGLMPDGVRGMWEVLRATGTDLLAWPAPIFSYPNVRGSNGQLIVPHRRGVQTIDSHAFLNRQVQHLRYSYDVESPMFYVKGVASTQLVDKVRARSEDRRFYSCPTPDGYSGIVLAGEVSTYSFSGAPFSLHGLSPSSQGLGYLSSDQKAKKASEAFFRRSSRPMHPELASQPYSPLITLMTADYLLTARDLPGWPGRFAPLDFRHVLLRGLEELSHGLYAEDRISRELRILHQIAELHGLGTFFRDQVRQSRRRRKKGPFEGSGVSGESFFLDGRTYGLHNVFDAAYVAHTVHTLYSATRASSFLETLLRSVMYRLRSIRKGGPFPPESEWGRDPS